jgi:hypothetical protein
VGDDFMTDGRIGMPNFNIILKIKHTYLFAEPKEYFRVGLEAKYEIFNFLVSLNEHKILCFVWFCKYYFIILFTIETKKKLFNRALANSFSAKKKW